MFDIQQFLKEALPAALLLVPIITGIVTILGNTFPAIKGRYQSFSSLAVGILGGTPVFWATTEPATAGDWVAVVLFGFVCGLTASGVYDAQKAAVTKGVQGAVDIAVESEIQKQDLSVQ